MTSPQSIALKCAILLVALQTARHPIKILPDVVAFLHASVPVKHSTTPFPPQERISSSKKDQLKIIYYNMLGEGKPNISLHAIPIFNWFQKKDSNIQDGSIRNESQSPKSGAFTSDQQKMETMQRTAQMMGDHRRQQEVTERTAAIMEELSTIQVVGKSKAGPESGGVGGIGGLGAGDRKGGVKVTFDGQRRPISVSVDPNFLFSSSQSSVSEGVISIEDLNEAILDAFRDGYELSGSVMEEKMKGLYEQLGLPREPPSFSSE